MNIDISVVVLAHNEGRLLHRTLRSVGRSIAHAVGQGMTAEVLVVADNPDDPTETYLRAAELQGVGVHRVRHGDAGLSRNDGVRAAAGSLVCFLEADNLCGRNWIFAAATYVRTAASEVVVHPEYEISFGAETSIWRQLSSSDRDFDVAGHFVASHWSTVAAGRTSLFASFPYSPCPPDTGFGFPERYFDCESLAAGIEHHVVPGTVVFRRFENRESTAVHHGSLPIMQHSRLFDPEIMAGMLHRPQ